MWNFKGANVKEIIYEFDIASVPFNFDADMDPGSGLGKLDKNLYQSSDHNQWTYPQYLQPPPPCKCSKRSLLLVANVYAGIWWNYKDYGSLE